MFRVWCTARFTTDLYDGHAYVYLEDGTTGKFLLDTWHNSFGNLSDFNERVTLSGYSFEKATSDMQNGKSGDLGFISKTMGTVLYMHYEPVGFNNWNIVITVEKQYAMEKNESVSRKLYRMAGIIAGVMALYMMGLLCCMVLSYRNMKRLAREDQKQG